MRSIHEPEDEDVRRDGRKEVSDFSVREEVVCRQTVQLLKMNAMKAVVIPSMFADLYCPGRL